ncbi:beta-glucuronidase [Bacteroidia bacterium]|nr:beta-glucuronidase [Bacteroidia bacterium]
MKKLLLSFLLLLPVVTFAQETLDLSGTWRFAMDRDDVGITQKWYDQTLAEQITLPGSMLENRKGDVVTAQTQWTGSMYDSTYYYSPTMAKYRQPGNVKFPFFLTPDFHYTGAAWYQTTVTIPKNWKGREVQLFLERPHIETTVWVDSKQVGEEQYSLCVPHIYDLTAFLQAGNRHTITIRVDNTIKPKYNPGIDSHSITDQTQGNWNGIVGKINLTASASSVRLETIQVYPDIHTKTARVLISLDNKTAKSIQGKVTLSAKSFNSDQQHRVPEMSSDVVLNKGVNTVELLLNIGEGMLTWDEFDPALYKLTVQIDVARHVSTKTVQFGMREIKIEGKWFYVNGRKIMLRGTVENCDFPLTGYAPMDVDSWKKVFKACKDHGLNHIRFHSFCPPEAAFIAADLAGIYLQPEGPSWPNHGVALGRGMAIDTFLLQETQAMNKAYGNYPSFCMLACGNEPAGNWVPWVSDFVEYWEKTDSRRVYTGASVGNGWAWQPRSQFHVKAGARGLNWNGLPETLSDYRTRIDTVPQPYVSHETGQWCVFPNFKEIDKYTGVYKSKNFEIFRDLLKENDMENLADAFVMASGKLQALCYKHEIEKTLRTPDYAGFQLLALNDYSGQGTALVGILDVFFEEKPYINAAQFRRFCNETVPLTRMGKFVFKSNEPFKAQVEIAHFGANPMYQAQVEWQITDTQGTIVDKGSFAPTNIPIGNCFEIGTITTSLNGRHSREGGNPNNKARQMNLEVRIAGTSFVNDWDFWVYPEIVSLERGTVLVTDTLDEKARQTLEQGGNVLLLAAGKIEYGRDVKQQLTPVFWNTSWFKMRPPHTTGLLVNPQHPVFNDFPTQYHSNLQWAELVNGAQVMQFTEFPKGFQPLVQHIHTWFISKKIGSLFEAKVGKGKLMMTSLDLQTDLDNRFVARQLLSSVLHYMNAPQFQPQHTVDVKQVSGLFTKSSEAVNMYTKSSPDELKPKIIN